MNPLENYLSKEYKEDILEIKDVQDLISKCLPVVFDSYCKRSDESPFCGWPYTIKESLCHKLKKNSIGTHGMVLNMLLHAAGMHKDVFLYSDNGLNFFKETFTDEKNPYNFKIIQERLKEYCKSFVDQNEDKIKNCKVVSSTYGKQDPFTLFACFAIAINSTSKEDDKSKEIVKSIRLQLEKTIDRIKKKGHRITLNKSKIKQESNTFVMLRTLHLLRSATPKGYHSVTNIIRSYFEKKLHLQLSYFDIPDSRFDPAELAFALEGSILVGESSSISPEATKRALAVLEKSQESTPHWRPLNPIYATDTGQILLPISVEVARSILRTCILLDNNPTKENLFSEYSHLFKRYFRWLKAQTIEAHINSTTYYGWCSEHVGAEHTIHIWQTSEILTFLIDYYSLLQNRIASRSLEASGLRVVHTSANIKNGNKFNWDSFRAEREPLPTYHRKLQIYETINRDFVMPRIEGNEHLALYSILLYGPPGTGKTSIAEGIAQALQWKLITVTPSDFLAGGSGEVEARAKAIFRCLEAQSNAVILFDEIDQFLLDRDSDEYGKQTGIFQFMTPGMLPKINDLRSKKKSIFIIATNYEERIDPAIKRTGRIDCKLALMPPDNIARQNIIKGMCAGEFKQLANSLSEALHGAPNMQDKLVEHFNGNACHLVETLAAELGSSGLSSEELMNKIEEIAKGHASEFVRQLAELTPLCTYGDIKSAKKQIQTSLVKFQHSGDLSSLENDIKITPSISLTSYECRFYSREGGRIKPVKQTPLAEYCILASIAARESNHFSSADDVKSLLEAGSKALEVCNASHDEFVAYITAILKDSSDE